MKKILFFSQIKDLDNFKSYRRFAVIKNILKTLAALLFSVSGAAYAQDVPCKNINHRINRTVVLFVNGINNTYDDACQSLGVVRGLVESSSSDEYDYDLVYNKTDGLLNDVNELATQARISDRAHDIAQNDGTILIHGANARYQYVLGKLYSEAVSGTYKGKPQSAVYIATASLYTYLKNRVLARQNIIVVAHSQGNYLIEAAIAMMRYRGEENIISHIKVIGVAPTSSTTLNGTYLSLTDDSALSKHKTQIEKLGLAYITVLPARQTGCVSYQGTTDCDPNKSLKNLDINVHSFIKIYANPQVIVGRSMKITDVLLGYIEDDKAALDALPPFVAAPVVQAAQGAQAPRPSGGGDHRASFRVVTAYNMFDSFTVHLEVVNPDRANTLSYKWEFGDGETSERDVPFLNHTYRRTGAFRTTLTIVGKSGGQYSCSKTYVFDKPFSPSNQALLAPAC